MFTNRILMETRSLINAEEAGDPASDRAYHATDDAAHWQTIWDETYKQTEAKATDQGATTADPTFNIIGWNSSYTGEPIPLHGIGHRARQSSFKSSAPSRRLLGTSRHRHHDERASARNRERSRSARRRCSAGLLPLS